ncbi:MAG: alpha/beta hydrolase [Lysobacterales bacterium]
MPVVEPLGGAVPGGMKELSVAIADVAVAAKEWGEPSSPPLLALHGWLDNAASFDVLAPILARTHHVVAPDLPGHGRSGHRPPGAWYHFVDYLEDIARLFAHFGWARADLLGHSLGGALATLFAATYPERVRRLVLIEALGPLTTPEDELVGQLRHALDERLAASGPLRTFDNLESAVAMRVRANGLTAQAARPLVERGVKRVVGGWQWSSDPRLMSPSALRLTEAQVRSALQAVRAPTLLVLADPPTRHLPRDEVEARAAEVPDLQIVRVPGHHHLHMENATKVAEPILAFLDAI